MPNEQLVDHLSFDTSLSNPDIAPVRPSKQDWKAVSFFTLWVGMAVNIPSYMIAASLIDGGMSWQQAMWTVLLGNLIVFVPMSLSGHAGTKYGIPFPISSMRRRKRPSATNSLLSFGN